MKKIVKQFMCLLIAATLVVGNCVITKAAKKDKDISYSDIMADEVEKGAKKDKNNENIDVEAEEIFGGKTASTTIDSSTKLDDSSKKKDTTKKDTDKDGVDDTPKTGMDDTSIYVPIALLLVAAAALVVVGVNRFGRKRFNSIQ